MKVLAFGVAGLAVVGVSALPYFSAGGSAAQSSRPSPRPADPVQCSLADYKDTPGLKAVASAGTLTLTWQGERNGEVRLQLAVVGGTPTIRELAVRKGSDRWSTLASEVTPEFRVVTGMRRISEQQLSPLRTWGKVVTPALIQKDQWHPIPTITPELIEREKWNPFWDAPLYIPGLDEKKAPPNPGLPRRPEEVKRATAAYRVTACAVKTDGGRLEVEFPGVELGVFSGRLRYTVYKGTNLIRQEVIASTTEPSVAYKYDTGLKGLALEPATRVSWRDLGGNWQEYQFGGAANEAPIGLQTTNRVAIAENAAGSIAAFPPPHVFFWAREAETNLGYNWYRKDGPATFAFGVQQAEREGFDVYRGNFALYSAPPGTSQRMAAYFLVSAERAEGALPSVLAYTRSDRFKPLPGYQVMGNHYHSEYGNRLRQLGIDSRLPDFDVPKAAGINILGDVDTARGTRDGNEPDDAARLATMAASYAAARRHSDRKFLIMPADETSTVGLGLGGHSDIMYSHPVYWLEKRAAGEPLVQDHPVYGKLYRIGGAADVMEMARRENMLVYMPHPRTKGSQAFPDAIRDTAHFRDANYGGAGWRWGMGLDLSERRLADARVMTLFDDMNNWVADTPTPKYLLAITETQSTDRGEPINRPHKVLGDDTYGMNPVNYVRVDPLPGPDDMSTLIGAIRRGDFFATTGEVLIPSYAVQGSGNQRTVVADVEWTFPLEFVEVVWGDGHKTGRQIIAATDLPPFGTKRFQIAFNSAGQKWVRFAVWDSAGNGAFVQPVRLQ